MVEYICDGCGRREKSRHSYKPAHWYQRQDDDGEQHACSRECIKKAAATSGKTGVVLPV